MKSIQRRILAAAVMVASGVLSAPAFAGGAYLSCNTWVARGTGAMGSPDMVSAVCQAMDKNVWKYSYISLGSYISNVNGVLYRANNGHFELSCRNGGLYFVNALSSFGNPRVFYSAQCKRMDGSWNTTQMEIGNLLTNNNGTLMFDNAVQGRLGF